MNNDYFDQSNSLITEILKQVTSAVNDKWDSITVTVRFAEGFVEFKPSYIKDGVKSSILIPGNEITVMLNKLKELNSSDEKGSLKGLVFQITPDNKFTVDYEY
jgi:hypothetical protein